MSKKKTKSHFLSDEVLTDETPQSERLSRREEKKDNREKMSKNIRNFLFDLDKEPPGHKSSKSNVSDFNPSSFDENLEGLKVSSLEAGPYLKIHKEILACYPLNWKTETGKTIDEICFQDDQFITDAVIESWFHTLKEELSGTYDITLKRCVNVTDWGLFWLAKIIQGRSGVVKVNLNGCSQVTESGLLELCAAGPTLELSCNYTRVASLPECVTKQNPDHRFQLSSCPLLQVRVFGTENEEKFFGPYNKVYIHHNPLTSGNLMDIFHKGETSMPEPPSVSMVTDWSATAVEADDNADALRKKPVKLNIIGASENDASYGIVMGEEADQVIIPFDMKHDIDQVTAMATRAIFLNAAKERPRRSTGMAKLEHCTLPTPQWSVQSMMGCTVDFKTGIIETMPYFTDRMVTFAEHFSAYHNKFEFEVLECNWAKDGDEWFVFLVQASMEKTSLRQEVHIKAGDRVSAEYTAAGKVIIKNNDQVVFQENAQGFPGICLSRGKTLQLKIKVVDFSVTSKDGPQHFTGKHYKNTTPIFDSVSRTIRFVVTEKKKADVLLFRGIQPITKTHNTVSIRLVNLGSTHTISLGLVGSLYPSVGYQPGWRNGSIAVHFDDFKVFNGDGGSADLIDRKIDVANGDIIKLVVGDMKNDVILPSDTVTLTYFHNGEEFVTREWTNTLDVDEFVVPAIGLHSVGECVELLDFEASVPLHHKIMQEIGSDKAFLTFGKTTCKLQNDTILSTDACSQRQQEYFMAGNSLSKEQPFFWIIPQSPQNLSVFSLGIVYENYVYKEKMPGELEGTVVFKCNQSGTSDAVMNSRSHGVISVNDFKFTRGDKLGFGFDTSGDVTYNEYGVPCADQKLKAVLYLNNNKIGEHTFTYLGGGLFPIITIASPLVRFKAVGLLGRDSFITDYRPIDLPVEPGTQYILAGICEDTAKNAQDQQKVEAISDKVKNECLNSMKQISEENDLLYSGQISFNHHKYFAAFSQHQHNLKEICDNWEKRTHSILIDPHTKESVAQLGNVLARNVHYSVQHHEHLYLYTLDTYKALKTICQLKTKKIVMLHEIDEMFPEKSQPWLVQTYLQRLHRWGKVLLFLDQDPAMVVTDPEWFLNVLSQFASQPAAEADNTTPFIKPGTPVRKPKNLLHASQDKLERNKLLQVLVESHQLLRLKPFRNDKTDPKYYLVHPSDLGPAPSEDALKKFLPSNGKSKHYMTLNKTYKFDLRQLLPYVWYAIQARLMEFCEPKMLWDQGLVWHQGAVECVLFVEKSDTGLSCMELRTRVFLCSSKRAEVENSMRAMMEELFVIYTNVIDATLYEHSLAGNETTDDIQTQGDLSMYAEHSWEKPYQDAGHSVCTLCNNCCNAGLKCDFNGILDDKLMSCLCETEKNCCMDCGICQNCVNKIWKYRSMLHPGNLNQIKAKDGGLNYLSDFPVDAAMLSEFQFTPNSDKVTFGLVSEDQEFYILWSLLKGLQSPETVYSLQMLYNYMEYFNDGKFSEIDDVHTYRFKVSDPQVPLRDAPHRRMEKYNFDQINRIRFYQETGVAECEVDSWSQGASTGYLVALHPLTPKCFYFEAELLSRAPGGFALIGLSEGGDRGQVAQFGFKNSDEESIVGDLEQKQKYVYHSPLKHGTKVGVGIMFKEEEAKNTIFFVRDGELQSIKVSSSHELYPYIGISGRGKAVRLTTRGAWRFNPNEVHEAMDIQMDNAKKTLTWGSYDLIELSPSSVLQFIPVDPGAAEVKEEIKAQVFIKCNADSKCPVIFKVKVTNPDRYLVRPNKGLVRQGETMILNFYGRCSRYESLVGDKFRIEWLPDELGLGISRVDGVDIGHEAAKWTVGWNENLAKQKKPDVATLTCKIVESVETNFVEMLEQFVKNIYVRRTQSSVFPKPLPKLKDVSANKPHYILDVYKNGQLCSQTYLPKKKYYLASLNLKNTLLGEGAFTLEGIHIPRMPRNSLPSQLKPGMKVYAKFTDDLHRAALSFDTFNVNTKKGTGESQEPGNKRIVKFASEPIKKSKAGVLMQDSVSKLGESEDMTTNESGVSEEPKQKQHDLTAIYGPCRVIRLLPSGKVLLSWTLGSLCLVDKPDQIWRTFEANIDDLHSELWTEKMQYFTSCPVEQKPLDSANTLTVWREMKGFNNGLYKWDKKHKSPSLSITQDDTYKRTATANQTDGIRGEVGFNSGVHVFRFENMDKIYGSFFQIGVCTAKANMQIKKYGVLFGSDKQSWAWNIPDGGLYHNGKQVAKSPRIETSSFTIEMKINIKDPIWPYIQFSIPGTEASSFVAFQDTNMSDVLKAGKKLYPCCGGVYGNHRMKISLVFSSQLGDTTGTLGEIGIYKPKKLETTFDSIPLPYMFPSEQALVYSSKDNFLKDIHHKISFMQDKGSKCFLKPAAHTVRQHGLSQLFRDTHIAEEAMLGGAAWIPLPEVLHTSLLTYPALQDLVDIKNLDLHFLCKDYDDDLAEVLNQQFRMHFIDRPASKQTKLLPEELCFGVPAIACAYMASLKVLLPTYEHLFPDSVQNIHRKDLEQMMQGILRLLSAVMLTNYPSENVLDGDSTDGWRALADQRDAKINQCKRYLSRDWISDMDPERAKDWLCSSHQIASADVSEKIMKQDGDQKNILDLSVYEPYNELLTNIELLGMNSTLEVIPDEFESYFPNLINLTVDQADEMKRLPKRMGSLKKLSTMSFTTEANLDIELLPEDLGDCKSLTNLRCSRAQIKDLPSLSKACNLALLSVGSNGLRSLPDDIGELHNLSELVLNYNPIYRVPQGIGNLKCLTALFLSGISFLTIASRFHEKEVYQKWFEFQGADILKVLTMERVMALYDLCKEGTATTQDINLHKVNAHLFYEVPRLGLDYMDGDEDGGIPEPIFQLENLETLHLTHQAIRFIPPQVGRLTKLEKLQLGENMLLHSLPGELGSMKKLRSIGLRKCPSLKTPPMEIVGRGVEAVKAYLRRLSGGTTENWRTKLMLVGLGGAGKTSLIRALTSPNHRTSGTSAEEVTDGIDINTWTVKSGDNKKITFSTWDFAGQDVYYNTHQFFLSGRAVYLLLWTSRLGYQHAGLDFWLSSIQCHAPKAPIFVVGTHCDQVAKSELPKDMLMKKYPQIKGFHTVSSIKGTGVAELKQHVIEVTKQESYMGESVPTVYLKLENKILQLRKSMNVVPWADVEKLATECGIFDLKDIKRAVSFLHDLGAVQYFDNEFLRDHVVINPQWIVDVMACVVSIKDSPILNGAFKHEDISTVWDKYPEDLHEWLLRLTEEFDLTFPIPSQPINLVPCLLPQTEPKFDWPEVGEGERETMMLYRFTYLPAGLFNRTQVRLFQFSDSKDIWKRGSLLRKNEHLALIKQLNDKEMLVRVQGPRPENILFLVHEVIESLVIESFSGVHYDFLIPCPDCVKKTRTVVQETALFEASLIKKAAEWNAPFLQCREHFHTLSMSVLQAYLPPDRNVESDVHLSHSVRALESLSGSCTTDLFMLYCDTDVSQNNDSFIHSCTVTTDLREAGFTCHYKENMGKIGIEEIMLDLKDSKMMVVFMSNNFERDKKCHELFLYAKHSLSKPYQVVACGENRDWMKTHLGGMEIGNHHLFVNMMDKKRYGSKIEELKKLLTKQFDSLKQSNTSPRCFLSYAWANSHEAVKTGSKSVQGALGWERGDPRTLKQLLEKNGISCWLDTEQTGKGGLFEDISNGIKQADMMVAFISDQYIASKNCMMELRYAECTLEKPMLAVIVGTGNKWMFSEIQALLHRSKTPIISLQKQNEDGLQQIVEEARKILDTCGDTKTVTKNQRTTEPSLKLNNISFHEEFELAQRKLLRHVSGIAATMETLPYPRLLVLDLKKTEDLEDNAERQEQVQQQQQAERPKSAVSTTQQPRRSLSKRDSKITRALKDDWTDSQLVVKLLCEYDGGCHVATEGVELSSDLTGSEKEMLVKTWSQYLGPVYALLKHSTTVTLSMMGMEQGNNLQAFVNHSIADSELDFAQAYCKMSERVMLADKDRIMGDLDRCYLPTGQIRWLCKKHQEGYRITVLSSDVDVGIRFGDAELVTEDDRLIAAHIEKMSHLGETYTEKRSKKPRKMALTLDGFLNDVDDKGHPSSVDVSSITTQEKKPTDGVSSDQQNDDAGDAPNLSEGKKPKPKQRHSLLGSADRPTSANTKAKIAASAQAMQSDSKANGSQACQIL